MLQHAVRWDRHTAKQMVANAGLLNATIELVAYRRLRRAPRLAALITAVGMSFIVQNISLALYGVGGGKWSVDEGKKKKD